MYLPIVGPDHPRRAVLAAIEILDRTGHRDRGGPWVPVGAGVHSGIAFVGSVGLEHQREFTALGDAVNVTARLASFAAAGEVLVTEDAYTRTADAVSSTESRRLELRGKSEPTDVRVVRVAPTGVPAALAAAGAG